LIRALSPRLITKVVMLAASGVGTFPTS
jgi:hypothetical protein